MARADTEDTTTGDVTRADRGQQSWQDALAYRNSVAMQFPVDPSNGLHYQVVNGKKKYFEPIMTPEQYQQWARTSGREGWFHGAGEWNPDSGQYEAPMDWLKTLGIIGGGIDAGVTVGSLASGAGSGSGSAGGIQSTGEYAGGLDAGSTAGVDAGTTAATSGSVAAPTTVGGLTTPGVGTVATSPAWTTAGSGISGATATGTTAGTAGTFSNFVNGMGGYRGLAGIGTNILGSYLQSRAANNATDAQLAAAREALAQEAQQYNTNTGLNVAQANQNTQAYNTTVANLAPYRGIGAAAASMAGYSLGFPGYETGNTRVVNAPPPITPIQPLAVPPPISVNGQPGRAIPNQAFLPTNQKTNGQPQFSTGNTWGNLNQIGTGQQMVTLKAPTGQIGQVPAALAQHYIQQGAQLLDASSVQPQGAA